MTCRELPEYINKLLQDRYYLRDDEGKLVEDKTEQMFRRVANAVAEAEVGYPPDGNVYKRMEDWEDKFYNLMAENKFLPNTPTLINAGKSYPGSFSACFVLPVEDSMEGIFDSVKNAALIHKAGGGTGFNFSKLREEGSVVGSTGHKSSGPLEFMKVFNQAMDTVKQGGARRGASMGIMNVDHPDIVKFIHMKEDTSNLTNFNISVLVTNEFMKAVENDEWWSLVSPKDGKVVDELPAKEIWNAIVEQAWKTGEPGLLFYENLNRDNPLEDRITAVNPCGELGLLEYESCNLGSINLLAYYNEGEFDYEALRKDIPTMVRFLDNVIDANTYVLPEIKAVTKATRKIGLGVMGWADLLLKMEIKYDSNEAILLAEDIMCDIDDESYEASKLLGIERGSFPSWRESSFYPTSMRNATRLCVAPTGTISRIAGVSSGIEPIFAWSTKHTLSDREYIEDHWAMKNWRYLYLGDTPYEDRPDYMVTASEISPEWHLKHQEAFQEWIDNSVSKTINLPSTYKREDVEEIFFSAWKRGIKGITVYRDGCRENQPLTDMKPPTGVPEAAAYVQQHLEDTETSTWIYNNVSISADGTAKFNGTKEYRKRPSMVFGPTYKVDTGRGKMYVTVNYSHEEDEPVEVFVRMGHKATGTEHELAEWSGRLLSLLLKYNVPLGSITRQSNKVLGDNSFFFDQHAFRSLPQLISYLVNMDFVTALDKMQLDDNIIQFEVSPELQEVIDKQPEPADIVKEWDTSGGGWCYQCGSYAVIHEGGCDVCSNCGDSKCG